MQRISIENFGLVKKFEADVTDVMLLIGPQASGKSTISKTIFMFKSIGDEIINNIFSHNIENLANPVYTVLNHIKINFLDSLGMKQDVETFSITYKYSNSKEITIWKYKDDLDIELTPILKKELTLLIKDIIEYKIIYKNQQNKHKTLEELRELEVDRRIYFRDCKSRIDNLFEDTHYPVFIPSGRSLMSTLTDQLRDIEKPNTLDYFTKTFVERINLLKPSLTDGLNSLKEQIFLQIGTDVNDVRFAAFLVRKILKGEYKFNGDNERIYIDNNKYVNLNYASSGQQESIWILLLIFKYILDGTSVFTVFEEPEAHLYPETQSDIVELIGLFANLNNNQIIITTHSPYILSSFNNLLYAHQVATKKAGSEQEAVESIVNKKSWIAPARTSAYFISENGFESIMDEELKLIQAEKIDSASSIINNKFNDLFNLDD
ncbi:hypothetical protein Cylst_4618 [Cylindrospermum stagnale PCC 7417]|uniref:Endonuclease GajA/Old nuclease/RecF-like AAA domain-containing protein n=1 Tax=Cylindrospermum stagnale PCC 7417 TaxID=56107 RepID=K9X2L6_9NOST|nr:AAA family ATPase [Cylindrospermum stagnale]AFZ26688.1 hypothetical protein Cylst_4618 [Cylindrospermum stagnale PCC 7417]